MPELPEVETVVRALRGPLTGRIIYHATLTGRTSRRASPGKPCAALAGAGNTS